MSLSHVLPQRWLLALLMFTGLITNYMLRVNISIAIVEMAGNSTNETNPAANPSKTVFNWSNIDKGLILSSFSLSYFVFQLPGGRLAEIFGTKLIFGLTMAGTAVLSALTPLIAPLGVGAMVTVRVLQGVLEAPAYPVLTFMISKWTPESEQPSYMAFALVGGTFGTIVTFPLCGYILFYWGWEAVFYVTASITGVWLLLWALIVHEDPEDHPYMSQEERDLILTQRTYDRSRQYKEKGVNNVLLLWDALTCPAMLATMLMEFANSWGLSVLLTYGPTFMKEVLSFDIRDNGLLSSLPWICRFVFSQLFGLLSGYLIKQKIVAPFQMQRLNSIVATLIPGAGMIWFSFTTEDRYLCLFILSVSFGFNGACLVGHGLNNITIAPNRGGTAMALSNGFGNVAGFLAPVAIAATLGDQQTPDLQRWKIVFGVPMVLYAVSLACFWIFGSGEVQDFDKKEYNRNDENEAKYTSNTPVVDTSMGQNSVL